MIGAENKGLIRNVVKPIIFAKDGLLTCLSIFFVCTVWIPCGIVAILLLVGVQHVWPAASATSGVLLLLLWHFLVGIHCRKGKAALLFGVVLGCISIAAGCSVFCYDMSFDGRWYHTDAILALLHGVNPIYSPIPAFSPVWANSYPKATWYFAALTIHAFHNYQLGKLYNFLLMFACAAYVGSFYLRNRLRGRYLPVLVVATAVSPVVGGQLTTYYVDGALACIMHEELEREPDLR